MKIEVDLSILSRVVFTMVIAFISFYLIYSVVRFGKGNEERQTNHIAEIIDKALIHCYALEGSYPSDIYYLGKYGVVFQEDKYIYHYEMFGANIKPGVRILGR